MFSSFKYCQDNVCLFQLIIFKFYVALSVSNRRTDFVSQENQKYLNFLGANWESKFVKTFVVLGSTLFTSAFITPTPSAKGDQKKMSSPCTSSHSFTGSLDSVEAFLVNTLQYLIFTNLPALNEHEYYSDFLSGCSLLSPNLVLSF